MTLEEVREEIEYLKSIADDDERAHALEDDLRHRVLEVIAKGSDSSAQLAKLVLTTSEIEFGRWAA